jgi:hypothetical protein
MGGWLLKSQIEFMNLLPFSIDKGQAQAVGRHSRRGTQVARLSPRRIHVALAPEDIRHTSSTWGVLLVILTVGILYALLPLQSAFQFGGDEGYQLITGYLVSKDSALYTSIWYDQPPLFIIILESVFRIFGPSIFAARVIAGSFGMLMFASFYEVVRTRLSQSTALLATFFLIASPGVLQLSVCVLQEVPTFAMALLSLMLILQWRQRRHWWWLSASAIAMGLALGIKLTAALVVPALMVEILLVSVQDKDHAWRKRFIISSLHWAGITGITLFGVLVLWGRGSFAATYRAHFGGGQTAPGLERPEDFPIQVSIFLGHAECVIAAAIGIVLAIKRGQAREFAIPGVWLATALAIHLVHRPWWTYYYLHLAIPMAWFAGFAVCEMAKPFFDLFAKRSLKLSTRRTRKAMALCILAALALVMSERRLEAAVVYLRAVTRVNSDPILAKIREYAGRTHWIYVRYTREAYAFHAGLLMPPELAVVSLKRFWSGQITTQEIVDTCERYKPEQVLLNASDVTTEWRGFLKDYSVVYQDADTLLFVRASLVPPRPAQPVKK